MEILTFVALGLSGLTLLGVLADKIMREFQERKPEGSIVISSSCCNKKKNRDDHSSHDINRH